MWVKKSLKIKHRPVSVVVRSVSVRYFRSLLYRVLDLQLISRDTPENIARLR